MLACRNCKISLDATNGCAICNPIRKHLVVVGEDEDDRPSLSGTGAEIVAALRMQLRKIRKLLGEGLEEEAEIAAEKRLLAMGNTIGKVLESARKLQQDGVSAVENMAFKERAELFITWITELTPVYRQALRAKWDTWEIETSKPIIEDKLLCKLD